MKKWLTFIVLLSGLVLVGCGGGSDPCTCAAVKFPISGTGTLHGTKVNTQNWTFIPIDLTQFTHGGTLHIDIVLGDGQSSASYDLFTTNTPSLTSDGRPIGSLVHAYDVPPNTTTNLSYVFTGNGGNRIYYLGIEGNWGSPISASNNYAYIISVK